MLVMNSPFREFDALFDQFAGRGSGPTSTAMPMDAYHRDSIWVLELGVAADSLDVSVERNVLTVTTANGRGNAEKAIRCTSPNVATAHSAARSPSATASTPTRSKPTTPTVY